MLSHVSAQKAAQSISETEPPAATLDLVLTELLLAAIAQGADDERKRGGRPHEILRGLGYPMKARDGGKEPSFMRLAGSVHGVRQLSTRNGFSRS